MGDDITIELRNSAFGTGYNSFNFGETGNSAFTAESTSGANIHSDLQSILNQQNIDIYLAHTEIYA